MEPLKILPVDDDQDWLELMAVRDKDWGYQPITASSGEEAINYLASKNADIIILDYMMPDMDGITTLRKIPAINTAIPVIMFTAHPDTRSMMESNTLGVNVFIPKLSAYSDIQSSLKSAIALSAKDLDNQKES